MTFQEDSALKDVLIAKLQSSLRKQEGDAEVCIYQSHQYLVYIEILVAVSYTHLTLPTICSV